MNLEKICRCCLAIPTTLYPLDATVQECGLKLSEMLEMFTSTDDMEKEYPQNVCANCVNDLTVCNNFFVTYKKSRDILRQQISSIKETEEAKRRKMVEIQVKEDLDEDSDADYDLEDQDNLIAQSVQLTNSARNTAEVAVIEAPETTNVAEEKPIAENTVIINNIRGYRELFRCPNCPRKFKRISIFGKHLSQHKVSVFCGVCSVLLSTGDEYSIHYSTYHLYQCSLCMKNLKKHDLYEQHMETRDCAQMTNQSFICPFESCRRKYQNKYTLSYHLRTIHGDEQYLCNQCGETFKNQDTFRYHLKKHEGPSHACPYCPKKYMQSVHLRCHMWRHTGVKPHECKKCQRTFSTMHSLRKHLRKNICETFLTVKTESNEALDLLL